jgi:hypothetical protein
MNGRNLLFSDKVEFSETKFSKLLGNFGNYAAPLPNNDTLFLDLFRNVINAVDLSFTNPSARIVVRNSTGIPINYSQTGFNAIRPGSVIPNVDLSSISFPTSIQAMSSTFQSYVLRSNSQSSILQLHASTMRIGELLTSSLRG